MITIPFMFITMLIAHLDHINAYDELKLHSSIFVDKTRFLEQFFSPTKSHRCIFLTSPSGFGKSTIVSMIDLFSGVEHDESNKLTSAFNTEAFKTFNNTYIVTSNTNLMAEHFVKYMIVKLKVEFRPESSPIRNSVHDALQKILTTSIERYEHLLQTINTNDKDREFFEQLSQNRIPISELPFILRDLIKILNKYFHHRVILLIDDYDTPAYGITHRTSNPEIESFYKIFNTMINHGVKLGSKYVHKALITSTNSLPFYWSGDTGRELDDFHHYEFLKEHIFTEFIGFDETEIQSIAENHQLSLDQKHQLAKLCNGYQTYYEKSTQIYKPKCVENYIHTKLSVKPSNDLDDIDFRSIFRDMEFLKVYLKDCDFEIQLLLLSYNKTISRSPWSTFSPAGISLNQFKQLQDELQQSNSNKSATIINKLMWTYLEDYGFVTPSPIKSELYYKAPNLEVLQAFREFVLRYHDDSKLPLNEIARSLQALGTSHNNPGSEKLDEAVRDLEKLLTECHRNVSRFHHTKVQRELILEAIIFASSLRTSWRYYSKTEVNYEPLGICDMYFYSKNENVAAIVDIEYGRLVGNPVLPNMVKTEFPHRNCTFLTVLSLSVTAKQQVTIRHVLEERHSTEDHDQERPLMEK
ncbi:uncharacterized protein LOC135847250 [Planococcus citri]|uniref:uncharacterized protein LOC135847250 n=1 Tax=Planococcus citri TaxID=170843 RepID=UPI0031F8600D